MAEPESADELRRQLDEMVRKTNDRNNYINSIFSSIDDGFMLVDSGNRVVLYNPKAMELLDLGPEIFFEDRAEKIAAVEPLHSVLAACARVTATRKGEVLRLKAAGERILEAKVNPITDKYRGASDFGSLAVVRDVTELLRLESLKKDFVANVSHEFRTPLTLISGFVEMFKLGGSIRSADRKRAFEIIDIETERLKRLVSELLTLSEIEDALPHQADAVIDVHTSIAEVVAALGSLAERKGQGLAMDLHADGAVLKGNRDWFYLAVRNLVENAIKYTAEGGDIRLRASTESGTLVVSVEDTGIGIAYEEQERVFERFYRVERSRGSGSGGSGLGLALVKDIVSIFGGRIKLESELGKGSVFTMILPLESEKKQHEGC